MNHHPLYRAIVAAGLVAASTALSAQDANVPRDEAVALESAVVTGSRIPRAAIEGPAPVTVVTAEDIRAKGLAKVYDVVRSLSHSTGSVQTQQFANLRNTPPHRDAANAIYPYYDQFQSDPIGRQYFIEVACRFGGSAGR